MPSGPSVAPAHESNRPAGMVTVTVGAAPNYGQLRVVAARQKLVQGGNGDIPALANPINAHKEQIHLV